jgi:sulfide:quinone oxidoreductase
MLNVTSITEAFAVAPSLRGEDYAAAAKLGFRTVVSFLPDGEVAGALSSANARRAADASGLAFVFIPAAKFDLFTDGVVGATATALAGAEWPVLATCSSGQRAAICWAAATARTAPVASILKRLEIAGFDLAFLRDDLDAQADRQRWMTEKELHRVPLAAERHSHDGTLVAA